MLSQAPALRIYRAVNDKAQIYHHIQGLGLQQGKLKSQSTLNDSMYTPSKPSSDLKLLSFEKKVQSPSFAKQLKAHYYFKGGGEQAAARGAVSLLFGTHQCTEQLRKSFSASYAY